MKQTKRQALEDTKRQWTWMRDHVEGFAISKFGLRYSNIASFKEQTIETLWPKRTGKITYNCFACEYNETHDRISYCDKKCIINWATETGGCETFGSAYHKAQNALNNKNHKAFKIACNHIISSCDDALAKLPKRRK